MQIARILPDIYNFLGPPLALTSLSPIKFKIAVIWVWQFKNLCWLFPYPYQSHRNIGDLPHLIWRWLRLFCVLYLYTTFGAGSQYFHLKGAELCNLLRRIKSVGTRDLIGIPPALGRGAPTFAASEISGCWLRPFFKKFHTHTLTPKMCRCSVLRSRSWPRGIDKCTLHTLLSALLHCV